MLTHRKPKERNGRNRKCMRLCPLIVSDQNDFTNELLWSFRNRQYQCYII